MSRQASFIEVIQEILMLTIMEKGNVDFKGEDAKNFGDEDGLAYSRY